MAKATTARRLVSTVLTLLSFYSIPIRAAELISLVDKQGNAFPLAVYRVTEGSCRGIVVFSHGAGGSERGYQYLGNALPKSGWLTVIPGHRDSGPKALREEIKANTSLSEGLISLISDPNAYEARLDEVGQALAWARAQCPQAQYRVLAGHSMGAATALIEAGAQNKLGVRGRDRFDAYIALSPMGPGPVFAANAWATIKKPVLTMTGTEDKALEGGWQSRTLPFQNMQGGCKWLGVVPGGSHMNFAGIGLSRRVENATLEIGLEFLRLAPKGNCSVQGLPQAYQSMLQTKAP